MQLRKLGKANAPRTFIILLNRYLGHLPSAFGNSGSRVGFFLVLFLATSSQVSRGCVCDDAERFVGDTLPRLCLLPVFPLTCQQSTWVGRWYAS